MATTPYAFEPSPMTFKVKNGTTTFPGACLKISASREVDLCGVGEGNLCIGFANETVVGLGTDATRVAVTDRKTPGLVQVVAGGAVAAGVAIYCAAAGQVDDAASGLKIGTSATACAAQADVFMAHINSDQQ